MKVDLPASASCTDFLCGSVANPFEGYGKYSVIYADPPWSFSVWAKATGHGRSAESHYPTMSPEDIAALPVGSLAAPDCALFLWGTWPQLDTVRDVMRAWGFTYKTAAFDWHKTTKDGSRPAFGMGYWTRAGAEFVLLGVRGHPKRVSKRVPQAVWSPRGRHSEKPGIVRDLIVQLMGDVPKIELFARHRVPGWDAWGNEVPQ